MSYSENSRRSDHASGGRSQKVKNDGKLINRQSRKVVVVVAYRVWSFSRGCNCKALTGKKIGVLDIVVAYGRWSLREVVVH